MSNEHTDGSRSGGQPILVSDNASFKIKPHDRTPLLIQSSETGRELLRINTDGTVTGAIEDAGEAAQVFVNSLRGMLRQPTQGYATVAAAGPDRIGGAGGPCGFVGFATQSDATLTALEQPTPELVKIALRAQNQTRWSAVRNSEGETIHNPTAQDGMKAALAAIAAHLKGQANGR